MLKKTLGVIGGIGPLATAYFIERVVCFTNATVDQDHLDMIVLNHCSIPDRTAYILNESDDSPVMALIDDAKKLEALSTAVIATPCNTAHYFYDTIQENVNIPIINMIHETAKLLIKQNAKKIGIMATKGTIKTGLFQNELELLGLEHIIPNDENQSIITKIIFEQVKANKKVDLNEFNEVVDYLKSHNCDRIILGCTELSIVKRDYNLDEFFLDSLDVLAVKSIVMCDGEVTDYARNYLF